jgi:hypothetical protein
VIAPKPQRKSPLPPTGIYADDKSPAAARGDVAPKPAKPPRKRRPRFVL